MKLEFNNLNDFKKCYIQCELPEGYLYVPNVEYLICDTVIKIYMENVLIDDFCLDGFIRYMFDSLHSASFRYNGQTNKALKIYMPLLPICLYKRYYYLDDCKEIHQLKIDVEVIPSKFNKLCICNRVVEKDLDVSLTITTI